ncbi:helix-turn-helix domain-containing protein [Dechloromonas sp. CZR5]|uniref:helix-turn-helix domain-containing protein n=1 Tax=Dechloromonas sp. CZR5 TaxID=2608630 RepID=UPI00123D189F|nr:helix-turn-helix domain-containing protein [Dechloromonas sp. CZR5]
MGKKVVNQSISFSVVSMLSDIAESRQPSKKSQKFNPRPAGVIQPGSATEAVLGFLKDSPGLKTEAQIIWATKFSHSAVSWALLRLRAWGMIDAIADPSRNSRYLRYKATAEASNQVKSNG